jgi:hypothetical protein
MASDVSNDITPYGQVALGSYYTAMCLPLHEF